MRKIEEPVERVHLHLYKRDVARIKAFYGGRLKFNTAVRELVRQMLDGIESRAKASQQKMPDLDLALEDEA